MIANENKLPEPRTRIEHYLNAMAENKGQFIVVLTPTSEDYSGTMDHTVGEIYNEYQAGKTIVFRLMMSSGSWLDTVCTAQWYPGDTAYPSFNGYAIDDGKNALFFAFTGSTDNGDKSTYAIKAYALTSI